MAHEHRDLVLMNPRLPTLPAVAVQVLELTKQPQTDLKQIADVIQNDQALTARIIRTVNSSYFGLSRPCADMRQAMVYLGLSAVKMLALGFSLATVISDDDEWQVNFNYIDYWRRSLHSAAAAREIATVTNAWDREEAFLAALLQDIGMIAFFRAYGDIYLQAIDLTEGDHSALPSIEERSLQTDHAKVGATLTARWNIPPQIVEAIRFHHDSDAAPGKFQPLARVVQLAGDAAAAVCHGSEGDPVPGAIDRVKDRGRDWFNLNDAQLQALIEKMAGVTAELAELFKVDIGGPAQVDDILSQAEDAQLRQHLELEAQRKPNTSAAA
jgi:HD-like signal output (HDOD) protein